MAGLIDEGSFRHATDAGIDATRSPRPPLLDTGLFKQHVAQPPTVSGRRKVHYRGIVKNANRLFVACALANLFIARRRLFRAQGA